jgi:hypothetical protein
MFSSQGFNLVGDITGSSGWIGLVCHCAPAASLSSIQRM